MESKTKRYSMPKIERRHRRLSETDIAMPSTDGTYAHRARDPRTNYAYQSQKFIRHKCDTTVDDKEQCLIKLDVMGQKDSLRAEKKRLKSRIEDRFKMKLDQREKDLDRRRHLLTELLCAEEHEYIERSVALAQEGDATKFQRMKDTIDFLKATRALEAKEFVEKKRIMQYSERCTDLRPIISKKNLLETKTVQLQQMRENQARRESQMEIDRMWDDLQQRENEAKLEREKYDALLKHNKQLDMKNNLQKQMEGKKLMKLEVKLLEKENLLELQKMHENMIKEDNQALLNDKRKKENAAKDLRDQMLVQQQFIAQRKKEELALDEAFARLAKLELENERTAITDNKTKSMREITMYKDYIVDLKAKQKEEEVKIDALLKQFQDDVNKEQDKITCKEKERKRKMIKDAVAQLDEQMAAKKLEAENNLRQQKNENEFILQIITTNKRLDVEYAHIRQMAVSQYRADLYKQIEYNTTLRKREEAELERQLQLGVQEENKYTRIIDELILSQKSGEARHGIHPFRKMLEMYDCHNLK